MIPPTCRIEEHDSNDPGWQGLVEVITAEGQAQEAFDPFFSRFPRHFVAARQGGRIVGFLMERDEPSLAFVMPLAAHHGDSG